MGCAYQSICVNPFQGYALIESGFAQGNAFCGFGQKLGFMASI
jgi:hypothetical protein